MAGLGNDCGYVSDGEAIARSASFRETDGYMSEGGAQFYSKRIKV